MIALKPKITQAGLTELFRADNQGLDAQLSSIALGDADGYEPTGSETALKSEKVRIPISSGERMSPTQIHVSALAEGSEEFWIKEVGFYLKSGTLLALWSNPTSPLAYKTNGVPLAVGFDLALSDIPPNLLTVHATGPSVNLMLVGPIAQMSAEILRLQRRSVESENARLIPQIQQMWS